MNGRYGVGIAQGLRGYPVLAVGAMKIAAHHAEAVGESTGMGVEEWFFFDGIALGGGGGKSGGAAAASSGGFVCGGSTGLVSSGSV